MSEPDLSQNLDKASSKADKLLNSFKQIESVLKRIGKSSAGLGGFGGANGSGNTGRTGGFNLGTEDANFYSALDSIKGGMNPIGGIPVIGGMASAAARMSKSQFMAMPDVNATINRMSMGYNAAIMNGNSQMRSAIERSTLSMMGNGLTSPGSDMTVANILASSGISYSANPNSIYMQNVRTTSNLAKYMNIDNATAAQSVANLTSGPMSGQLMRMGIMTSDPRSGQMLSTTQILRQFENRITGGKRPSSKEAVLRDLHSGWLGASLSEYGLDETQQQMVIQDLIHQAETGKAINWEDSKELDRLSKDNPMLAQYKLSASDTKQMGKAEGKYKEGIDTAVDGLVKLNDAAGDLAAQFGNLKSGLSTFLGHRAGAGSIQGISDLNKVGSDILNSIPIVGPVANSILNFFRIPGFNGGNQTMGTAFASGSMASISGVGGSYSKGGGDTPTTAGDPGANSGAPAAAPRGTISPGGTSTNAKKQSYGARFTVIKPVKGGSIIADYGIKGKRWNGGVHKALDWSVPEGTPVVAAHDGIVHISDRLSSEVGRYIRLWYTGNGQDRTYSTGYAHLSSFTVPDGTSVKQGDLIAYSGQTGTNCDGPHLHFEVWRNGERVNPHDYIVGEATGTPTKASTSGSGASSSTGADTTGRTAIPLPIGQQPDSQFSVSKGNLSGTGKLEYLGSGGGSTSTIGIDPLSGGTYSSRGVSSSRINAAGSKYGLAYSGRGTVSGSLEKPNVTINLSIQKASELEARKFAETVKKYLEEDSLISSMGGA